MAETSTAARHGQAAAWAVLVTMGGESLTFNVYHALHGDPAAPAVTSHAAHAAHAAGSGHLALGLAVLYGLAPVAAAMGLSHIAAASRDRAVQVVTYLVMLGAMGLSMGATADVVGPVAGLVWKWVFPLVMDAAALIALRMIISLAATRMRGATITAGAGATNGATSGATKGATTGATSGATSAESWPRWGATAAAANGSTDHPGGKAAAAADNPPEPTTGNAVVQSVDFSRESAAKRGGIRELMRDYWDQQTGNGRVPNGAELNRAAGREPGYSLGKRYAAEWRAEMNPAPAAGEEAE